MRGLCIGSAETSDLGKVSFCLKNTFLEVPDPDALRPLRLVRSVTCPAELVHTIECVSTDASEISDDAESSLVTPETGSVQETTTTESYDSAFTTVMLRHIPNKYSPSDLLHAIDNKGCRGTYDFMYLPADFRSQSNCGYAFINFRTPQQADNFSRVFRGFRLPALRSSKVCDVSWARIQGLTANVDHYRNNPINSLPDDFFKPLIFNALGFRIPFPRPDRVPAAASLAPATSSRAPAATTSLSTGATKLGAKIFVGGLSPETSEADLRTYFGKYGEIAETAIVTDKKSGMSRGFGFCCFAEPEMVDKVLSVRQHLVLGHSVGVRRYSKATHNF